MNWQKLFGTNIVLIYIDLNVSVKMLCIYEWVVTVLWAFENKKNFSSHFSQLHLKNH